MVISIKNTHDFHQCLLILLQLLLDLFFAVIVSIDREAYDLTTQTGFNGIMEMKPLMELVNDGFCMIMTKNRA